MKNEIQMHVNHIAKWTYTQIVEFDIELGLLCLTQFDYEKEILKHNASKGCPHPFCVLDKFHILFLTHTPGKVLKGELLFSIIPFYCANSLAVQHKQPNKVSQHTCTPLRH